MKQIQKILTFIIGMMILASPVALGQEADNIYFTPDTLHFTSGSGCPAVYNVVDLAIMFKTCVPLFEEARDEALQLLESAIQDENLLGDYFKFEVGSIPNINDFTVIAPQNDEDKQSDESDRIIYTFFSEETIIIYWDGAGWTSLDEPEKQSLQMNTAIEMYYVVRHEYEVSQTPKRDSR